MPKSQSPVPPRRPKVELRAATDPAPPTVAQSTLASFHAIVDRVEQVVDSETEALTHSRPIDLALLHRQKRQGLLELSRIMRRISGSGGEPEAGRRLAGLAARLEVNREVLDRQLRAVNEVADIIALSIKASESDGTYSRLAGQR